MTNKIMSRYYIAAELTLASPLSLSGGIEENTDSDVMRDGEGRLFVPGSSIAGAFRRYMGQKKDEEGVFGYSKNSKENGEEGCMSSLFISDVYFDEENSRNIVSERDGVKLTEQKTVDNKFDYEIIETGASAILHIEKVYREKDAEKGLPDDLSVVQCLLSALNKGEIRLGARKNRGCGWIKVNKVYKHVFSMKEKANEYKQWVDFCLSGNECDEKSVWEDWERGLKQEKYVHIEIPLRLTGGISIRKYSTKPEEADFEHLTIHGQGKEEVPVIPGTSWNGAIRDCARNILHELKIPAINEKLRQWFGFVDTLGKGESKGQQSMVVFKESQLRGAIPMKSTRNKINRFDASTVDGALYTERAYFGGRTILTMLVQKTDNVREYYPLIALLSLVIEEIKEGYLAVGGQTAVGRGIFEADIEKLENIWNEEITEKECMRELAALRKGY